MPSVLDQFQPSADSRSGRVEGPSRYIFRYFNGHFAVTTPHLRESWRRTFRQLRRCATPYGETPQLALVRYPLPESVLASRARLAGGLAASEGEAQSPHDCFIRQTCTFAFKFGFKDLRHGGT